MLKKKILHVLLYLNEQSKMEYKCLRRRLAKSEASMTCFYNRHAMSDRMRGEVDDRAGLS